MNQRCSHPGCMQHVSHPCEGCHNVAGQSLEDALKAVFFETLDATTADYERVATMVPKDSDMWVGPRRLRTWESSVAFSVEELAEDRYGCVKLRIMSLAREVKRYKDETIFTIIAEGFANGLFTREHGNMGTTPLSHRALLTTQANLLVVPPDLQWLAMDIIPYRPGLELLVSPYLTEPQDWFLLHGKPMLWQDRTPIEFAELESDEDKIMFRVRQQYNAGYGDPKLAWGSKVCSSAKHL